MENEDRRSRLLGMVTPLRLIFWGSLLCILDLSVSSSTNGVGFRFDFLNDFVGMILVTMGVFRLSRAEVTPAYAQRMTFVKIVSVIAAVEALLDHWVFRAPAIWNIAWGLFGLVQLVAIVVFCLAMQTLCRKEQLDAPARSWHTTTMLVVFFIVIPIGFMNLASIVVLFLGRSSAVDIGPLAVLLIPIFLAVLVPVIHFFISTSRMAHAAKSMSGQGDQFGPGLRMTL